MKFEFATAARIVFGPGAFRDAAAIIRSFGQNALVVMGSSTARATPLLRQLDFASVSFTPFLVAGEPTTMHINAGIEQFRENLCDVVVAFGGGSAIDAAKAIAGAATQTGGLLDYLEVIGRGQPLVNPAMPVVAIPTTAGTGAEVTRNAVITSPAHRVKASLRSPFLLPRVALVDPELTHDLPPALTASTGMDALTQLIEPFTCARVNPLVDALCVEGIRRAARSLRRAFQNGSDAAAREDMALASLFGGLALANAGLGAVHGFAAPIGGMFHAPHGAVCAALLPHVMAMNLRALEQRAPQSEILARYAEIARLLTGRSDARASDGVAWTRELCRDLGIAPLSAHGLGESDVAAVCENAAKASSMKANPIALTPDELADILRGAIAGG